ncbi:MAG: porin [Burkholderiaceae bacterium]
MRNKKAWALALTGLSSMLDAAPAIGEPNISLYGAADVGFNRTSNREGSYYNEIRSGNLYTSRFGMRGQEDLGGGLTAIFNLESGINMANGTPSSPAIYWNRQSWAGLSYRPWGQITLGNQLPVISDVFVQWTNSLYVGNAAAAIDGAAQAAGSSAARFNNMIGGTRVANMIKLTSANFAGFKLIAMAALRESSQTLGHMHSVGMSYGAGPVDLGLAWHQMGCPGDNGCETDKAKETLHAIGANLRFGQGGRVGTYWTRERNARNVSGRNGDVLSFLVVYPLSYWTLMAGYQQLNDRTAADQNIKQINLGFRYALSKRTDLYALYNQQKVDNGGKAGMYSELSSSSKQSQVSLGVRHMF